MRSTLFLFAGAMAMLPLAAHAADEKTLGCVVEHLDAPTIALIESSSEAVIRTPPGGRDSGAARCRASGGFESGA